MVALHDAHDLVYPILGYLSGNQGAATTNALGIIAGLFFGHAGRNQRTDKTAHRCAHASAHQRGYNWSRCNDGPDARNRQRTKPKQQTA
jgi:hypothetical protein